MATYSAAIRNYINRHIKIYWDTTMLNFLRKHKKGFFGTIVLGLVTLLMAGFGLESFFRAQQNPPAIQVDGHNVTYQEVFNTYSRISAPLRQQLGAKFNDFAKNLNLKQQAIDSIIDQRVLAKFADELEISASSEQVIKNIAKSPYFNDKELNRETMREFISLTRTRSGELESGIKQELVKAQLNDMFGDLNRPTETELKAEFKKAETARRFKYITFKSSDFIDKVEITDEALAKYFEENKENYRKEKAIKYKFVPFLSTRFISKVQVSEEEIADEYDQVKSKYKNPPAYSLRHIYIAKKGTGILENLFDSPENSDDDNQISGETKKELAEQILSRVQAGEDFAEIANEVSEDSETNKKGGDLGFIDTPDLDILIKDTVQNMEVGEISDVIETVDGYKIVKLEEVKKESYKSFDEVSSSIESALKLEQAPLYASSEANEMLSKLRDPTIGQSLEELAKQSQLATTTTDFLTMTQGPQGYSDKITSEAFDYVAGERFTIEVETNTILVEVVEIQESHIPEFDSIKARITSIYKNVRSGELAAEQANTVIAQAKTDKLEQAAKAFDAEVQSTAEVKIATATSGIFASQKLKQVAFNLEKINPIPSEVFIVGDNYHVIELQDVIPPKDEEFEKGRTALQQKIINASKQRSFQILIQNLRDQSDININSNVLEQLS